MHTPRGCRLHFWDRPADRNWTRGVTSSSNCRYHMATPASTSSGQAPAMAGMASSSTSETSCWQCCCCRRKCSTGAGHGISNPAGHQRTGYCQTPAHLSPTPHHGYHPCSHASHAIPNHYQTRPATETVEGVGPSASSDTTTSPYDANWCTLCASRIGGISPMRMSTP